MKREHVIDLYFMEARAKLIDLAAFLDRVDRAPGTEDFRMAAFRQALQELPVNKPDRAKRVLLSLSERGLCRARRTAGRPGRSRSPQNQKVTGNSRHALHRTSRSHGQPHHG